MDALSCLSEVDLIQYLCYEAPEEEGNVATDEDDEEEAGLLTGTMNGTESVHEEPLVSGFAGLNALEMAIVAEAKYFVSMRTVQR